MVTVTHLEARLPRPASPCRSEAGSVMWRTPRALAPRLMPGHLSLPILFTDSSGSSSDSLAVLCSSFTLLVFFVFLALGHSLDLAKCPVFSHTRHSLPTAGHLSPSPWSKVQRGHTSLLPLLLASPRYLPLYLPLWRSFLTSSCSSSAVRWLILASRVPPWYLSSSLSSTLLTVWEGLARSPSALALELSLLTAAVMTCFRSYSSVRAFSASERSLRPARMLILLMSSLVMICSSVLHSRSCSSTSLRKSMKDLLPCSILSRSMMARSRLTSLRRVFLVSSSTSL